MLYKHLNRLIEILKKYEGCPKWEGILLVEDSEVRHEETKYIPRNAIKTPEEFSQRFEEILGKGYDWINLVANGVLGNNLLVSIELPSRTIGASIDEVTVNLSGPYFENGLGNDLKLKWFINDKVTIE